MYTFMLSHNVKLPALKEHKEFLGFSLFGWIALLHLPDSATTLLKYSLQYSTYYTEKFEWLQHFQCSFDFFYVHHLFLIILF